MQELSYRFYSSVEELPEDWDSVTAGNVLLQKDYLRFSKNAPSTNMKVYYLGLFHGDDLVNASIVQVIELKGSEMFPNQKMQLWKRKLYRILSANIIVAGNMTLTGENLFIKPTNAKETKAHLSVLDNALKDLHQSIPSKRWYRFRVSLLKDFYPETTENFPKQLLESSYKFSVQPNMVLDIREEWKAFDDYLQSLTTKYRTRYKRARKKLGKVELRELDYEYLQQNEALIFEQYQNVMNNARFNTLFLPQNHITEFKKNLSKSFKVFGYFEGEFLLGFFTLIKNQKVLETYFLGYDGVQQRERQVYLNMLYDMLKYAINNQFEKLLFGRTALEIKSTIGAEPQPLFGLLRFENPVFNFIMKKVFSRMDPSENWEQRKPFKSEYYESK